MIRPALTEIGIFLIPFGVYALFLLATRAGVLAPSSWPLRMVARLVIGSLLLVIASLVAACAILRQFAEFDLRSRPYRERQARSRSREMNDSAGAPNAPWLTSGPASRVLTLLNGGGEEARVVGGAVRNALLGIPIGDIDIATTALPDEVVQARQGGRHQERADRHRARHRDAGGRAASRSRSRPCARTPRPSAARPRSLSAATGSGDAHRRDFTINALSVGARRRRARLCRRARRHRRAPRALHRRRRGSASKRIICASCASSASMPPSAPATSTATAISPASAARAGLRRCRPSACAWRC